jgi:hypothetical protein
MRRKNVKCPQCYEESVAELAKSIGYEVLGKSELGPDFRIIKKDCGCIDDIRIGSLRVTKDKRDTGQVTCKKCYRVTLAKSAEECGFTLLEDIDTYNIRIQFNACGHFKNAKKSQVLKKNLVCRDCAEIKHIQQVSESGIEYIGKIDSEDLSRYRMYRLPCGHEKVLRMDHAVAGSYLCEVCGDSHYTKPSSIYLFKMETKDFSWLKLGYSLNFKLRKANYGLTADCKSELLYLVDVETGSLASSIERGLHRKFKSSRLCRNLMTNYHLSNGHTECYPISMQEQLLDELRRINDKS